MLAKHVIHPSPGELTGASNAAFLSPTPFALPPVAPRMTLPNPRRSPVVRVLVVEDDPPVRDACAEIAGGLGCEAQVADSVASARLALSRGTVDLVLLDLKLPGGGGLLLLEEIRSRYPETTVIIMTAYATVSSAVEAMRLGATDYLTKPFTMEELTTVFERAAQRRDFDQEARALRDRLRTGKSLGDLVGRSPVMEKLYRILSKVSLAAHPVLICGEAGTGKELVARTIHSNGPKAAKPFIIVDCGSLAPAMMESELFGHTKGAYPGATQSKTGLLGCAEDGTVFLDDIDELPLDLQGKLLRALQDRAIRPLGAAHTVPICARILAASNRDLPSLVANGRFRKDLYFRLNVVNIRVPALRERRSDIPLLAAHLLERMRRETGVAYTFGDDALRMLVDHEWSGNVRELEQAVEHACSVSSGPVLHTADFPTQLQETRRQAQAHAREGSEPSLPVVVSRHTSASAPNFGDGHRVLSIAELERQAILNTIRQLKGDKLMAAKLLGIGKTTLYRKLKEYGLSEESGAA